VKRSRVTGAIIFALHQADTRAPVAEACRQTGVSEATYYNWNRGGKKRGLTSAVSVQNEAELLHNGLTGPSFPVFTKAGADARHGFRR